MQRHETHYSPETSTQELPNFALRLRELMVGMEIPEGAVTDRDVAFASGLLDEAYATHGDPTSPQYKPYHNTDHDFYVLRRAWDIWGTLHKKLPDKFDADGFRLLLFSVCGHDLFLDSETQEGSNERRSGKFTLRRMISAGYDLEEGQRVREAIDTTAVRRDKDGHIIQYNIRQGSKDPLKFVLAYADIYGIPMEGVPTMIRDAVNIFMESSSTSLKELIRSPKRAVGLMLSQAGFVQDRLDNMAGDIAHYFVDKEAEIVKEVLGEKYSKTSREALAFASRMNSAPELAETAIRKTLESTGRGAHSISSVPAKISQILTRKE